MRQIFTVFLRISLLLLAVAASAQVTLVKDISNPNTFTRLYNEVFFHDYYYNGSIPTTYLYKSDGTTAGTTQITQLTSRFSSYPRISWDTYRRATVGNLLFYTENFSLWRTDGTAAGTFEIIKPGYSGTSTFNFAQHNGILYFNWGTPNENTGVTNTTGQELWRSDGTVEGTYMVKEIIPGPDRGVEGTPMVSDGNYLYFSTINPNADGSGTQFILYRTDGTAAGTVPVPNSNYNPHALVELNGSVYYIGYVPEKGKNALMKVQNGVASEVKVAPYDNSYNTGLSFDNITTLFKTNNYLFFFSDVRDRYSDPKSRGALWRSDGTTDGTVILSGNTAATSVLQLPNYFTGKDPISYRNLFIFPSTDNNGDTELWRSDGTPEGTYLLKDINPGVNSSIPSELAVTEGGICYFIADDGAHGQEVWRTDGTIAGTQLVQDLCTGPCNGVGLPAVDQGGRGSSRYGIGLDEQYMFLGNGKLYITCSDPAPTVTLTTPASVSVSPGSTFTATVSATGNGVTYQWFKGTTASPTIIYGQTSATLTLPNAQTAMNGQYFCYVTGSCGATNSPYVQLTVYPPTTITQQPPASATLCAGSTTTAPLVAVGENLTYQWYITGPSGASPLAGQTTATLSIPNVQTSATYYCVVTGTGGSATSTNYVLTVVNTPAIVYVTVSGSGNTSGSSWANALPGNQLASRLVTATGCTQFYIASGTYKPNSCTSGCTPTDRGQSFSIGAGISVYGGFAGTESTPSQRVLTANQTIWSGDLGTIGTLTDNTYNVVSLSSFNARIDGVTVRDGNAVSSLGGAGINIVYDSRAASQPAVIANCRIGPNRITSTSGGGVYTNAANTIFTSVTFTGNSAPTGGGLTDLLGSSQLTDCVFTSNTATSNGGAIYSAGSSPLIVNTIFSDNRALNGGAVYSTHSGVPNYVSSAGPRLVNCLITSNRATSSQSGAFFINATGSTNNATAGLSLVNSTVTDNFSGVVGSSTGTTFSAVNSIFWANSGFISGSASASVTYSDIEGGYAGTGNLNINPLFVAASDYRLQANSALINVGNNSAIAGFTTDLSGNARISPSATGIVDIGAYEYQQVVAYTSIYTLKAGAWSDPTVWSCGRVPTSADAIVVNHIITMPASYTATAQKITYNVGAKLVYTITGQLRLGQ